MPFYNVLGSDNFVPDANPLNPAKWMTPPDDIPFPYGPLKALSGECVVDIDSSSTCAAEFIGATIPNDQWLSFKLDALVGLGTIVIFARGKDFINLPNQVVQVVLGGPTIPGNSTIAITATNDTLFDSSTSTLTIGDTIRLSVVGSVVYLDINGVNIFNGTAPGVPASGGMYINLNAESDVLDTRISNFQIGSVTDTPAPTVYSVPDSRTSPNNSRGVQGTLTYDVPKSFSLRWWFDTLFNRTQPLPVDSRVSAPVDSRKAANIPQNSRTFPPF